ncbi:MAG: GNAT family N-acetyltransferase [Chloroflexi bacterium]|nr:GNAT family N-acetyltransferase [Chloroflexota bacterium]
MSNDAASYIIRPVQAADRPEVERFLTQQWGVPMVVSRGKTHYPAELPGFVAIHAGKLLGLITYRIEGSACEIVTIDSLAERIGIGAALIAAVREVVQREGCTRLWLITTNDNLNALRFYQKRGFCLVAVHRNAVMESRRLKPQIPLLGHDDIPLRDEIELEMQLD